MNKQSKDDTPGGDHGKDEQGGTNNEAGVKSVLPPVATRNTVASREEDLMEDRVAMKIVRERLAHMECEEVNCSHMPSSEDAKPAPSTPGAVKKGAAAPDVGRSKQDVSNSIAERRQAVDSMFVNEAVSLFLPTDTGVPTPPPLRQLQGAPGAVPVAGMNSIGSSILNDVPEDQHLDWEAMQRPPMSAPFEPAVPIEATLVHGESSRSFQPTMVQAEPMDSEAQNKEVSIMDVMKSKRVCFILTLSLCAIVVLAVCVTLGVVFKTEDKFSSSTITEQTVSQPPFTDQLDAITVGEIKSDPSGPLSLANTWMRSDPNLDQYPLERQLARFVLAAEYFSLKGDEWVHKDNWLEYNIHECDWYSSHPGTICNEDDQVHTLNLSSNGLKGQLTGKVGIYLFPPVVDLSNNSIGGTPTMLYVDKENLRYLDLSRNQLSGRVVVSLGWKDEGVQVIRLSDNNLGGDISQALNMVPNAVEIDMSGNAFTGSVPSDIHSDNFSLQVMNLANNRLGGTLASTLGLLEGLKVFNLSGNHELSGTIPTELSLLTLEMLDVSDTALKGSVPEGICLLESTQQLEIRADCEELQCC